MQFQLAELVWVSKIMVFNYKKLWLNYGYMFGFFSGVRKPPVPFGLNGRSVSGSVVPSSSGSMADRKSMRLQIGPEPTDVRTATLSVSTPEHKTFDREPFSNAKRKFI